MSTQDKVSGICRRYNHLLLCLLSEVHWPCRTCKLEAGVNAMDTPPGVAVTTQAMQCACVSITQQGRTVMCVRISTLTDHGIALRPLIQTPVLPVSVTAIQTNAASAWRCFSSRAGAVEACARSVATTRPDATASTARMDTLATTASHSTTARPANPVSAILWEQWVAGVTRRQVSVCVATA